MNDRVHFASLLLASHMGVFGKSQMIEAADKRICEVDNPDPGLIELSSQGHETATRLGFMRFRVPRRPRPGAIDGHSTVTLT